MNGNVGMPLANVLQSLLPGMIAGSLQQPGTPAASNTAPPMQAPAGPNQPLPFEQMQSPAQAGSPLAQSVAQGQAGPLGALAPAAAAAGGAGGAAGAGAMGAMSKVMPWLAAYQFLQQNAATPSATFGGGRGGYSSPESGL